MLSTKLLPQTLQKWKLTKKPKLFPKIREKCYTQLLIIIITIIIIIDQITKFFAERLLNCSYFFDYCPHIGLQATNIGPISLKRQYNFKFAFSGFEKFENLWSIGRPIIVVVGLIFIFLLWKKYLPNTKQMSISAGFILGGGISNGIDSLFRYGAWGQGGVLDFIRIDGIAINGNAIVFNFADIFIVIAILLLLATLASKYKKYVVNNNSVSDPSYLSV